MEDTGAVTGFVEGASSGEKVKETDFAVDKDAKQTDFVMDKDSTLEKIPSETMDAKKTHKDSTLKKIPA